MRQGPHQVAVKSTTTVLPALDDMAWSHSALECTTITCAAWAPGGVGGREARAVSGSAGGGGRPAGGERRAAAVTACVA